MFVPFEIPTNASLCRALTVFRLPCFNLSLSLSDFLLLHLYPNGLYSISPGLNVIDGIVSSSLFFFFGGRPLGLRGNSFSDCGSIVPEQKKLHVILKNT